MMASFSRATPMQLLVGVVVLGVGDGSQGGLQVGGPERPADPGIDLFDDLVLADIETAGVGDAVGVGVLGGVGASVVVAVVAEAAYHPPVTQAAEQQARQGVAAFAGAWLGLHARPACSSSELSLDLLERVGVDKGS